MADYEKGVWLREGDLLFTLEHAGWHKGEEQLRNRLMVRVEAGRGVPQEDTEALLVKLHEFLKDNRTEDQTMAREDTP